MALQLQNVVKSSLKLANARALSTGVFTGTGFEQNSKLGKKNYSMHHSVVRKLSSYYEGHI